MKRKPTSKLAAKVEGDRSTHVAEMVGQSHGDQVWLAQGVAVPYPFSTALWIFSGE